MPVKLNLTDEERRLRKNRYQRRWAARNPDKVRAAALKWRTNNQSYSNTEDDKRRAREWRVNHPKESREYNKRYYHRGRPPGNFGAKRRWSSADMERIMDPTAGTDHQLAAELNRSVAAIQVKRYWLGGLDTPKNWNRKQL